MRQRPPDWQLPLGVSPGLWDYLHQPEAAARYDAYVQGSDVIAAEGPFLHRHCRAGQTILDVGCGTGRTLTQLAALGCQAIGVDLSEAMLSQANRKLQPKPTAAQALLKANLVDLGCVRSSSVDAVVCLFSTLGLIHPHAARVQVLQEARRVLKPGGRLLLHAHSRTYNLWLRDTRGWWFRDTWRSWIRKDHEPGNWTMPAFHGVAGLQMHLFTPPELRRLLQLAGFRILDWQWLGLGPGGVMFWPWFFPSLRAHGFLVAAEKFG